MRTAHLDPTLRTATTAPERPRWYRPLLTLDAVGCAAIAVAVVAFAGPLADGFHLDADGVVLLAAALFAVAAAVNGVAARTGRSWPVLVAIDLDAIFALWMALVLVSGRGEPWARGLAAAGLTVSLAFGSLKAAGWWRRRG